MRRRFVTIAGISVFCLGILGCGGESANRGGGGRGNANVEEANPAVPVTVARSESRDIPATIQATGSMAAEETSDIAPKTAGRIANIGVNVGQFVGVGAVIAKIDERDARLQLASAQASVRRARVSVTQAEARLGLTPNSRFNASAIPEVRVASANYEQALAELKQAEANERRYRSLTESGDVALIQYETFRTTRDTARARANAARQTLEASINTARQNNQAIAAAQADVALAQNQVNEANQALADTVIRAPFSGFVSARPVAVGEYVSSASVVATLVRTNPIKVQIQIAEADLPYVVVGRGVSVQTDAYRDRSFAGTVIAVNPAIDPASRSAIVEASIENGDNALRPGMFATVRINREGGGKGVFIPRAGLFNDQATQAYRVYVIQEGVAKQRTVQIGPEEGDWIQILDGVQADETVATNNLDQLYEGARVAVSQ